MNFIFPIKALDHDDHRVGGHGSHLKYLSGSVVSIDTENHSFQMDISGQEPKNPSNDSITIDCTILHNTEANISFSSLAIGDVVTIGYLPPLDRTLKAICITNIIKGDKTMDVRNYSLTRRSLVKMGAAGAVSAITLSSFTPLTAHASPSSDSLNNPKLSILVANPKTGEIKASFFRELNSSEPMRTLSDKSPVEITDFNKGYNGNTSLYSIGTKIALREDGYTEVSEEADESLEVYAKVTLGVLWGTEHNAIQIQRGTFEVSSKHPLISYSNTSYAMMQKGRYISDIFNGSKTTIETNWPSDPFDESTDINTCGGAVIGGGFNLLTGEEFWFQIEIYL